MKKNLLIVMFLLFAGFLWAQQDSIKNVVISEWRGDDWGHAYIELTNMDEDTVDLANIFLQTEGNPDSWVARPAPYNYTYPNVGSLHFPSDMGNRLWGKLAPGQSIVITTVLDAQDNQGRTQNLQRFLDVNHILCHKNETPYGAWTYPYHPELEMWGYDSVSRDYQGLARLFSSWASILYYCMENGDSIVIDQVQAQCNWHNISNPQTVAGIDGATATHILVRKFIFKVGNQSWPSSSGVDYEDSEWIVVPEYRGRMVYTTVGNHGDYHIDIKSSTVTINAADTTMLFPWGVYKRDSVMMEFTIGDGMGWVFVEDTLGGVEDSVHNIVRTGDILNIFACGNELEWHAYKITVKDAAVDEARVFPLRRYLDGQYSTLYYVTTQAPVIDSIGDVPFATRVDTLFKYLDKAVDASWEIVWVDGNPRVDLMRGDILKVTAENGTTVKEYFIDVQEYEPSNNANLGAITWPDMPGYLEYWKQDTIPEFTPLKQNYVVRLPYGTRVVPALTAIPVNMNAEVTVERAVSLRGGAAERTTTFTVTADTTILVYSVTFELEKLQELIQNYMGEPFISEVVGQENNNAFFLEICNPRGVPLDLSEYLFVGNPYANPGDAVTFLPQTWTTHAELFTAWRYRYGRCYVPGYKFSGDTTEWQYGQLKLHFDPLVDPVIDVGDVFVMHEAHRKIARTSPYVDQSDVIISGEIGNPWGEDVSFNTFLSQLRFGASNYLYMFKILNDSILNGTKELGDITDLKLIDAIGPNEPDGYYVGGVFILQTSTLATSLRRKPYIYQPNPLPGAGFGTTPEDADWIMINSNMEGYSIGKIAPFIGWHIMDPITGHLSTVASTSYLVDDGYQGDLKIQGDLTATTVEQFFGNLSKANPDQKLTVISGTSGAEKGLSDPVAANDTLKVISADSTNMTKYSLLNQPLDNNAVITLANAVSNLSIEISGETGKITGVTYGTLLKEMMDSIVVPELATAMVIDGGGNLVPWRLLNFDTVLVDTRIGDDVYIEVVAQDGSTKITYKWEPAAQSSDAFVISSIYNVDQEKMVISDIAIGLDVRLFWKNIEVVRGATATLLDKAGFERKSAILNYDDKLKVVSEDQSKMVVYYLDFLGEMNPDYNVAPSVAVSFADTTIDEGTTISVTADVEDDGMPYPGNLTYTWSVVGDDTGVTIASSDQKTTDVTFATAGSRELMLTVSDGELSASGNIHVTVNVIKNVELFDKSVRIYPNPARDILTLELVNVNESVTQVKIVDITGKIVLNSKYTGSRINLNLSGFENGLYFLQVESEGYTFTQRFNIIK